MAMAKTAVASYWLNCPHCEADLPRKNNGGSFLWPADGSNDDSIQCLGCYKLVTVPKRAR